MQLLKIKLYFLLLILGPFSVNASDGLALHWEAPKEYTSGEHLSAKRDLKEYKLYYGSSLESIKDNVFFIKPSKKSLPLSLLNLSKLNSSLVYFAMTSVSLNGDESQLSKSIFYLP